jgi:hypothetical protein
MSLAGRPLDAEDFKTQLREAQRSFNLGYYVEARAELRSAILIIGQIENRSDNIRNGTQSGA